MIMSPSGPTWLSVTCYFSELALKESNEHVVNVHGGPRHHLIEI